jgi:hypothetical protein
MGIDFERGSVDIDQHQDKMNVAADEADRSDERLVSPVILLNEPNDLPLGKGRRRVKSSLRLRYEAETHVIERKIGDLESIREKLQAIESSHANLHVGLATQALGTRRFIIVAISTALFIGLMIGFVAAHAF